MENASISSDFALDAIIGRQSARANTFNAFPEDFSEFLKPQAEEKPAPRHAERGDRPERPERPERADAAERQTAEVKERDRPRSDDQTERLAEDRDTRARQSDETPPTRGREDRADAMDERSRNDRSDASDKNGVSRERGEAENQTQGDSQNKQNDASADPGEPAAEAALDDGEAIDGEGLTVAQEPGTGVAAGTPAAPVPSMVSAPALPDGQAVQNPAANPVMPAAAGAGDPAVSGAGTVTGGEAQTPLPADAVLPAGEEVATDSAQTTVRNATGNTAAAAQEQVRVATTEISNAAQQAPASAAKNPLTSPDTGAVVPNTGIETPVVSNKPAQNGIAAQQTTVQTIVNNAAGTGAQAKTASAASLVASAASTQRDVSGGQRFGPDPTFLPNLSENSKGQAIEIKNPVTPSQRNQSPGLPVRVDTLALRITSAAQAGQRQFEIMLDPPELGRIDVKLEFSSDGQLRAHLTAERHDTLDLLQRDARMLERTLQTQGLKMEDGSLQFSLRDQGSGQGNGAGDGNGPGANGDNGADTGEAEDAPVPIRQIALPGRLNVVL